MERILLEKSGFRVTEAEDGEEALRLFRKQPGRFDIIVTDLMMPRLPGDELCRRIKKERPEVPIVLVSGVSIEAAREAGFDAAVHKPLDAGFAPMLLRLIEENRERTTSTG